MKKKKYISGLGSSILGVVCAASLASCDGGSDGNTVLPAEVVIPDVPNAANIEAEVDEVDESGADISLEAVYEAEVFDDINAERVARGLPALALDSLLTSLAEAHNENLISRANVGGVIQIDHDGAPARAQEAFDSGAVAYGENIAGIRGFGEALVADTFVQGWVNSPGHFVNLTGDFTITGVAVTVDERDGTIYATQIFAR